MAKNMLICLMFACIPLFGAHAQAETAFRWNNENWFQFPHPKVAEFTVRADGSAYGLTETGIPFYQENIRNPLGMRIQRFTIQDHYHYIIEGKEAYTFESFASELALAYKVRTAST